MVEHLIRLQAEDGHIAASTVWFPSCSFLEDTARVLVDVLGHPPGLYLLDGNPGWSFLKIAVALNKVMGNQWDIRPVDSFRWNNQLIDKHLEPMSIEPILAS